jgi:hypothetical protein
MPAAEEAMKADFRRFLFAIFQFLGKEPTAIQYDIARWLQHGPKRKIVLAFRGVGKSWLSEFYVLWLLYCDPQVKVFVVSASAGRAVQFTNFVLWLIRESAVAQALGAEAAPAPVEQSVRRWAGGPPRTRRASRRLGITSQKTGSRADEIVPDDIEIPENSATTAMRQKISEGVKEFAAIIKPGGRITYLGTYQTEESIYLNRRRSSVTRHAHLADPLPRRRAGQTIRPSPRAHHRESSLKQDPALVGKSVEPQSVRRRGHCTARDRMGSLLASRSSSCSTRACRTLRATS